MKLDCCWLFAIALLCTASTFAAEPKKDHCVVLVSIDGLANFYLDDPRADLPTLRRMIKEGARAQGTVCSFPTVTWPNHTTLVTGVSPAKHGVLGNGVFDREKGEPLALILDPVLDKADVVNVPTIYDVAHDAGLVTAGIIWPATRNAKTLDFCVPDMRSDLEWRQYGTAKWLAELRDEGVPVDRFGTWFADPDGGSKRDWLYTQMAAQLLEKHAPNLLMVHLIEVDHVEHAHGPRSPEAYWAVRYADDRLRDLVAAAQRSKYKDNTTFVVVSDHGFFPIEHDIRANVLLKKLGLIEEAEGKLIKRRAWSVAQGGGALVYILDDEHRDEIAQQLAKEFAALEGVDAVIGPERFAEIGQPTRTQHRFAADLCLSAKSGYSFNDAMAGDDVVAQRAKPGGTHGYLPDQPDMLGTLVVWGPGVEAGQILGKVSNESVAPTIARLLNLHLPTADGKPLELRQGTK
jgi:predicted AlkP superfamily pyrophosphatase or phosphodiesterase